MSLVPFMANELATNPQAREMAIQGLDLGGKALMQYGKMKFNKRKRKRTQARQAKRSAPRIESAKVHDVAHLNQLSPASGFTVLERKTLFARPIRFNLPPDTNGRPGAAPANVFTVSGFKLCMTLFNEPSAEQFTPIHVHMALVQPKELDATGTDIPVDMFTDPRSGVDRYSTFEQFSSNPLWDAAQDCFNLNPNKFNIMTHKRFILESSSGNGNNLSDRGISYVKMEKYYKVNKKFQYETTSDSDVMKPIWFLLWFETVFPKNTSSENLKFHVQTISYTKPSLGP